MLAKYYRPKGTPLAEAKGLGNVKEQKAFEKGLWEKTKKAGGTSVEHTLAVLGVSYCCSSMD